MEIYGADIYPMKAKKKPIVVNILLAVLFWALSSRWQLAHFLPLRLQITPQVRRLADDVASTIAFKAHGGKIPSVNTSTLRTKEADDVVGPKAWGNITYSKTFLLYIDLFISIRGLYNVQQDILGIHRLVCLCPEGYITYSKTFLLYIDSFISIRGLYNVRQDILVVHRLVCLYLGGLYNVQQDILVIHRLVYLYL